MTMAMTATNANRFSTYTSASTGSGSKSHATAGDKKRDLWNSLLDSVASGRRLPERNVLVFGGSVESQREFLESLARSDARRGVPDRQPAKLPPVANRFALGYTYYDVLDADQEDILARINLYLLAAPSPAFGALLRPLLTPETIPHTQIVVLLDWAQPWRWLRQLRQWILLLRSVLVSLSPACKEALETTMDAWRDRGRGGAVNLDGTAAAVDGDSLPPGPGEWEDALGLPLCVVCQNSEKTDILEKTQGWKDDEFDLVLQYLRTVLVKHGASLIYTTPNVPSQLPTLLHACLGITSLLKRQPLKPEVIKRTEVVVPSNWDSWTKILVVREGFDVERVSAGWSMDLQKPFPAVHLPAASPAARQPQRNGSSRRRRAADDDDDDAAAAANDGGSPAAASGSGGRRDDVEVYEDDGRGHRRHGLDDRSRDAAAETDDNDDNDDDDEEDPNSAVAQYERAIRDPGLDVLALAAAVGSGASGAAAPQDEEDGHEEDDGDDEDEEDDDDDDGNDDDDNSADGRAGGLDSASHDRRARRQRRRRRRQRARQRQRLEVGTEDVQRFLAAQLQVLEQLRQKEEARRDKEAKEARRRGDGRPAAPGMGLSSSSSAGAAAAAAGGEDPAAVISSHIGPVQFNLGGIQVDADDMLEKIKNRRYDEADAAADPLDGAGTAAGAPAAAGGPAAGRDLDTEKISAFFAGLMNQPSQAGKP